MEIGMPEKLAKVVIDIAEMSETILKSVEDLKKENAALSERVALLEEEVGI